MVVPSTAAYVVASFFTGGGAAYTGYLAFRQRGKEAKDKREYVLVDQLQAEVTRLRQAQAQRDTEHELSYARMRQLEREMDDLRRGLAALTTQLVAAGLVPVWNGAPDSEQTG